VREWKGAAIDGISYLIYYLVATQSEWRMIGRTTNPRKPLVWLHGEIKTPPFTVEGRQEAGMLLRLLQEGEILGMPQAEPLPSLGKGCGALRVRDQGHNWRIVYRIDPDAILVVEVYAKKSRAMPDAVAERCRGRLRRYDSTVGKSK
jgi:phage-related protein